VTGGHVSAITEAGESGSPAQNRLRGFPGVDDLAVPVTEDRAGLAVHLMRFHHTADPDERRAHGGEHPGQLLGTDETLGPLRGLAAAVAGHLDVSGERLRGGGTR
jgi:hypothetical protein